MTSSKEIKLIWKEYKDLSSDELYAILHLRQKVFVLEQDCPYIDADYSDQDAFHLLAYKDNDLIGYLRAFKPGIKYEGSSLGRIVTEINSRGLGVGKMITIEGVNFLRKEYSNYEIVISAQHRLQHFYIDLGFTPRGEVYLEDNIDHIQMYFIPTQ
ncbi:GNAT family N-acetyltransferase [Gammaproteobacteria bacterium]|nr:GNAT family N-acetyltransferase [Gammaproteobacteria bacterium]MDA8856335.1 GNAT family N-acetyltransferase [Gammaproteobacteria bacterium]MDA9038408.1 GNAT family N-acetyltransferase [Gammaproteobacteria bacterium]MDA9044559.1 GNAT family N-acetyltransferase [Gammaproteobacteria bacterium]MDA9195914.1 GNAT family N-acetyltransferase [Gammaproteobacteria bacterium]|tara:strand:- start:1075 stop:1542 length:468 start_codon:yes stop_codon:yes gene_type:complete